MEDMSLKKGIVALQTKCLWENFTHILQEFYPVWLNSVRGSGNYPSEELYEHYFKLLHIPGHLHQSFCNVYLYVVILLMKASKSAAIWWNKMLQKPQPFGRYCNRNRSGHVENNCLCQSGNTDFEFVSTKLLNF